jgi:hypothetical protein
MKGSAMPTRLRKQQSRPSLTGLTAALVAAAAIGLAYAGTQAASHKPSTGGSTAGPTLYLSPSSQNFTIGQQYIVEVRENSGTTTVNALQANLSYPASLLTVAAIDSTASDFSVNAQSADLGGTIAIARGNVAPLSGDHLVGRVTFYARARGTANVDFTTGTSLVDSVNNQNVLAASPGGQFRIR